MRTIRSHWTSIIHWENPELHLILKIMLCANNRWMRDGKCNNPVTDAPMQQSWTAAQLRELGVGSWEKSAFTHSDDSSTAARNEENKLTNVLYCLPGRMRSWSQFSECRESGEGLYVYRFRCFLPRCLWPLVHEMWVEGNEQFPSSLLSIHIADDDDSPLIIMPNRFFISNSLQIYSFRQQQPPLENMRIQKLMPFIHCTTPKSDDIPIAIWEVAAVELPWWMTHSLIHIIMHNGRETIEAKERNRRVLQCKNTTTARWITNNTLVWGGKRTRCDGLDCC